MWPNGLLVSFWILARICGHGAVFFARWHVSDVRPFVASEPVAACVFERCSSGPDTLISCSHSVAERKSSHTKIGGFSHTFERPGYERSSGR